MRTTKLVQGLGLQDMRQVGMILFAVRWRQTPVLGVKDLQQDVVCSSGVELYGGNERRDLFAKHQLQSEWRMYGGEWKLQCRQEHQAGFALSCSGIGSKPTQFVKLQPHHRTASSETVSPTTATGQTPHPQLLVFSLVWSA
jgi:hypothetical protein